MQFLPDDNVIVVRRRREGVSVGRKAHTIHRFCMGRKFGHKFNRTAICEKTTTKQMMGSTGKKRKKKK
jgi:hypothetical protein